MHLARHLRAIGLLACGAVLAAIAGVAYGSVNQGGQVHGCYSTATPHQLQVIDPAATPSCPSGTTPLTWVQRAPSVYSTFHDLSQTVPASNVFTQVGALQLPAGSYLVIAKLWSLQDAPGFSSTIVCQLAAGTDSDTNSGGSSWGTSSSIASPTTSSKSPMTFTVVHKFTSAGAATLGCNGANSAGTSVSDVKITAIKVGSISNLRF